MWFRLSIKTDLLKTAWSTTQSPEGLRNFEYLKSREAKKLSLMKNVYFKFHLSEQRLVEV